MYIKIGQVFEEILKNKKYITGKRKTITFDQFRKYLIENVESLIIISNSNGHNYPMNIEIEGSLLNVNMSCGIGTVNLSNPSSYSTTGISRFILGGSYNSIWLRDIEFKMKFMRKTRKDIEQSIIELEEKIEDNKSLLKLMDKYHLDGISEDDKKTILAISKIEKFDLSKDDKEKFKSMKDILENI